MIMDKQRQPKNQFTRDPMGAVECEKCLIGSVCLSPDYMDSASGLVSESDFLDQQENGSPVILSGLEEFREHLGGKLTITLIPAIGEKLEVHEMDHEAVLEALSQLRGRVKTVGYAILSE